MTSALLSLLLRDVGKLFLPKVVMEIKADQYVQNSTEASDSGNPLTYVSNTEQHPSAWILYVLSDISSLFQYYPSVSSPPDPISSPLTSKGTMPSNLLPNDKDKDNHITHKLRFYTAHILSLPSSFLSGFVASINVHAEKLRLEAEAGI